MNKHYLCSAEKYIGALEEDIKLEYHYATNRMIYDQVAKRNSEEFSYLTLPEKKPESVPQQGENICLSHWSQD